MTFTRIITFILPTLLATTLFSTAFFSTALAEENKTQAAADKTQAEVNTEVKKSIDITDRGGDFSLIGKNGWVSLSDFKGKVVAIYFGYTTCPDVCPTNLGFLSGAISQLNKQEKENFQSIFISVDPGRDTPDKLVDYVKYFDEDMIGLSAAPDDLDPVVAQYGAYYEKVPYSNSA